MQQILNADFLVMTGKVSALVDGGYSSLQAQMHEKKFFRVLKAGILEPFGNKNGAPLISDQKYGVYLELHQFANPRPFFWGDIEVHFDYSLLDRQDYHINPGWSYGVWSPFSASPAVNPGRVRFYLETYLKKTGGNEVVYSQPVPLSQVVRIMVPTGQRAGLLKKIKDQEIPSPVAIGWESLIQEQPKPDQQ